MLYNCMRSFILKYIVLELQMILHTDLEQAVDAWITAWALIVQAFYDMTLNKLQQKLFLLF